MKNVIQLKNKFINVPLTSKGDEKAYLASVTLAAELMKFGFILETDVLSKLALATKEEIQKLYQELIEFLKKETGSNRSYSPFWKNFPEEVMEKNEAELWLHQITHYMTNGCYEPSSITRERAVAFEHPSYTKIRWGSEDDYLKIFTDLVSINQSLSPDDLEIVKYFVSSGDELRFPSEIPFKENLCTLAAMGIDVPVKTVTDVLRIAVHLSGGDISLPKVPPSRIRLNSWTTKIIENPLRENFKFKKFKRAERKRILQLLEKSNCDVREMVLKSGRWVRLGEVLHPGEYKKAFPRAYKAFEMLRNKKVISWYGEVDSAFKVSFEKGLEKLIERPGELMRRMDWLLRTSKDPKLVLETLEKAGLRTSNKVLYEIYGHFILRESEKPRVIKIKGSRSFVEIPTLPAMQSELIENVKLSVKNVLRQKFSKLDKLGKVWVDEALKKVPLPSNMRSVSSSLKPTIRGQRVPMNNQDAKVIRAYVHWFDEKGCLDLDLTATYVGEESLTIVGWNGIHSSEIGCYSGDVRHRKGACAEYIDIDVEKSLKSGYRYVMLDVRNYNGGSFLEIPECVFGYMEREHPRENEIFVPSTLANACRLQSNSSSVIVAIIDLETQEYIFVDLDQSGLPVTSLNLEKMLKLLEMFSKDPAFSVYDLLKIHAEARGEFTEERNSADIVLDREQFLESYVEIAKWMGV
jgi:hypothetical protein